MIRVLLFLAFIALLALGASWLADRPGDLVLVWQGYRIETSLAVALVAVVIFALALMLVWTLVRLVFRLPGMVTLASRARRRTRGFAAVSRGMIAVGAGDPASARRHANDAERLLGRDPLALLLKAQAAQISGDRTGAETAFNSMLDEPETRVLGLRGLYVEARRKGDMAAARAYAMKAAQLAPSVGWANEATLEYQCADRNWRSALATLERRASLRLVGKEEARRQRAVLLTADAQEQADHNPEAALAAAREAAKLAPGLAPAVALAGRLLARQGSLRKAAKVLEAGWRAGPHPDIADAWLDLRAGDSTHDRMSRASALAKWTPGHPEALIALAEAALAAQEPARAREALEPLLAGRPTARVCRLMAEIEEAAGAAGAAREWLARAARAPRDACWIADGVLSARWAPVSPVTGRLDAFHWGVPPEAIAGPAEDHRPAPPAALGARPLTPADAVIADADEAFAGERLTGAPSAPPRATIAGETSKAGTVVPGMAGPGIAGPDTKMRGVAASGGVRSETSAPASLAAEKPSTGSPSAEKGAAAGMAPAAPARPRPAAPVVFPMPHAPDDPGPPGAEATEGETDGAVAGASPGPVRFLG